MGLLIRANEIVVERTIDSGQRAVDHLQGRVVHDCEVGRHISIIGCQAVAALGADPEPLLSSSAVEGDVATVVIALDVDHSQRKERICARDRVIERQRVVDARAIGRREHTSIGFGRESVVRVVLVARCNDQSQ